MEIRQEIKRRTADIEARIAPFLPQEKGFQQTVLDAMEYSVFAGGKRLRPMLMEASYQMFDGTNPAIDDFMAAIEMIHTYSLIHDDLPAMDNDEYRRGKKTTHAVYGEAMAILAGDALLNYAFETVAAALTRNEGDWRIVRAFSVLAQKAGIYGMIGGQVVDVESEKTGQTIDRKQVTFGFRTAEFRADGFYLNGKKTFLRGLNRHQSYPYIGYAAPESLQREDARILQEELHCTAVRTSHYPQSQYFLDECDRRGLLVFTELPGWQHIGDDNWKDAACEMLREMLLQNRNHPSIILWGVRINESVDDDAFYTRTNKIAHQLDPSRATSGVRYLEKSHLLEDVYAYNDFSHNGVTPGAKPKKDVTPDMGKALLISECNGHMYPTKAFDDGPHRQEHALRHVRVQNAAYASGEHAGCFGWCMFDYQTHKDFGSGDRICYHGVLDSFRNPKLAAAVYASQGDADPVLAVSSSMDIGDNPAGQLGTAYVFSNAQQVKLYKNDVFVTALRQSEWTALPHPPFVVDDTIGELLETQEHFSPSKAAAVRDCLLAAGKYGLAGLPLAYKVKFGWCMLHYKMTFEDGVALYGKYVGNWGGEATRWRFDAVQDGNVVRSVTLCPSAKLHLEVKASRTTLREQDTYDMAAVRVRILDENGIPAPYAQFPVQFTVEGSAALVGPQTAVAEGGMTGTYLRTVGIAGESVLTVSAPQTQPVVLRFTIEKEDAVWN